MFRFRDESHPFVAQGVPAVQLLPIAGIEVYTAMGRSLEVSWRIGLMAMRSTFVS